MSVTITRDRLPALKKAIRALTKTDVYVGVPDEKADREPEPGEEDRPITNAGLGYVHEFGAPEKNIPARPFLIPGVKSVEPEFVKHLKIAATKAIDGELAAIDKEQNKIGLIAQSAVQKKITDGPFVPLAEATLAARRRRGRTGDRPLIDTGQLRRAITYVIRPRGK